MFRAANWLESRILNSAGCLDICTEAHLPWLERNRSRRDTGVFAGIVQHCRAVWIRFAPIPIPLYVCVSTLLWRLTVLHFVTPFASIPVSLFVVTSSFYKSLTVSLQISPPKLPEVHLQATSVTRQLCCIRVCVWLVSSKLLTNDKWQPLAKPLADLYNCQLLE